MMQTSDTAKVIGLQDRGVLAAGMRADVLVIDMDNLQLGMPEFVAVLPTQAQRWTQSVKGYKAIFVAGVATFLDDKPTGELPGRLVRNPFRGGVLSPTVIEDLGKI